MSGKSVYSPVGGCVQPPYACGAFVPFEGIGRGGPRAGPAPFGGVWPGGRAVGVTPFGFAVDEPEDKFGRRAGFLRGRRGSAGLGLRMN